MSAIVRSCGSPCVSLAVFWLWLDWLSEAAWSLCEQPNSVPVASAMVKIAAMALFLETLMEPSPFAPRASVLPSAWPNALSSNMVIFRYLYYVNSINEHNHIDCGYMSGKRPPPAPHAVCHAPARAAPARAAYRTAYRVSRGAAALSPARAAYRMSRVARCVRYARQCVDGCGGFSCLRSEGPRGCRRARQSVAERKRGIRGRWAKADGGVGRRSRGFVRASRCAVR